MYSPADARTMVNNALSGTINGQAPRPFTTAPRPASRVLASAVASCPAPRRASEVLAGLTPRQSTWIALKADTAAKITTDDLASAKTDALVVLAVQYAASYAGSFEFMLNMRDKAARDGALPRNAVAGTLNCLLRDLAGERRGAGIANAVPTAAPAPTTRPLPQAGYWTVTLADSGYRTLKVAPVKDKDGIAMCVSYLAGPDNTSDYRGFAWIRDNGHGQVWGAYRREGALGEALAVLLNGGPAVQESKLCQRCGHVLTARATLEQNVVGGFWYGPECITKIGQ